MAPSVSQIDMLIGERGDHDSAAKQRPRTVKSSSSSSNFNYKDESHSFSLSPTMSPSNNDNSTITYLFPDFRALRQVCSKEETIEERVISGYEIYIVEQWACERKYSTVITAYTGDSDHSIRVGTLVLPANMTNWSKKMKHFIKEIEDSGAKLKLTEHGYLFITNLSQFPSNLNLLHVQGGCVLEVWDSFLVNLDLRKLRCSGRSAIMLCAPPDAAEDKFRQIYKIHPKVDIMYAVKELITLTQICLVDFKLLDPLFVDGLFCQKTEEKIGEWWNLYGTMYYGITPKDGTLGPTTVAALLGFVLSCNFRLDMAGSDFPKEPFNYFNFRVNVGKFQKQYGLDKSYCLDPSTVEKLFRVTSKTSKNDISKFKKVVKSTVHDISGKASSEQSAAEVLTTDLEKSIKYFNCSARLEYLWLGKGDVRCLKGFDYSLNKMPSSNASTLRNGVGKIRNLPKMLQSDESTPKKRERKATYESPENPCTVPFETRCFNTTEEKLNLPPCEQLSKKDAAIFNRVFEFNRCLKRRNSYPYFKDDFSPSQLNYENCTIPALCDSLEQVNELRKVKSFSFIDDGIEKWSEPQISEEKLSNLYIDTNLKLYQSNGLTKLQNLKVKEFKKSLEHSQQKALKLKHQVAPLFKSCEYENNQQERANLKIKDIQATGARLTYELRLLSTKVRDTEESVDDFVRKVEELEKAVNGQAIEPTSREVNGINSNVNTNNYWYSRLITNERFWKYMELLEGYSPVQWFMKNFNVSTPEEINHINKEIKNDNINTKEFMNNETTIINNNEKLKQT